MLTVVVLLSVAVAVHAGGFSAAMTNDLYNGNIPNGVPTPQYTKGLGYDLFNAANLLNPGYGFSKNEHLDIITSDVGSYRNGDMRLITQDSSFTTEEGATVSVFVIGRGAANINSLGYYRKTAVTSTRIQSSPLLTGITGSGFYGNGSSESPFLRADFAAPASTLGWYIATTNWRNGQITTFYSEAELNADGYDHLVTYAMPELQGVKLWFDGPQGKIEHQFTGNAYLIGFKDTLARANYDPLHPEYGVTLGDDDYNDIIILVDSTVLMASDKPPVVPEPAMIDPANKYVWAENSGWLNLRPLTGGVMVARNYLSGYAWHENLGWLKLGAERGGPYLNTSATDWGVNRDPAGNLWGYAWSEGWGWVTFNPPGGGVSIDPATGSFSGYAWAENYGWISFRNGQDAPATYGVGLASYTLHLFFQGTGTGSVTSDSPPFSCNTNCTQTFFDGYPLTLTAAAGTLSFFEGWEGCDAASATACALTLGADRTASVTFSRNSRVARIDGLTPAYFTDLQTAYEAAADGSVIQVWGGELAESLLCGQEKSVTISGGYDEQYLNRNGTTTILGLTVATGVVTVDQIVVR